MEGHGINARRFGSAVPGEEHRSHGPDAGRLNGRRRSHRPGLGQKVAVIVVAEMIVVVEEPARNVTEPSIAALSFLVWPATADERLMPLSNPGPVMERNRHCDRER